MPKFVGVAPLAGLLAALVTIPGNAADQPAGPDYDDLVIETSEISRILTLTEDAPTSLATDPLLPERLEVKWRLSLRLIGEPTSDQQTPRCKVTVWPELQRDVMSGAELLPRDARREIGFLNEPKFRDFVLEFDVPDSDTCNRIPSPVVEKIKQDFAFLTKELLHQVASFEQRVVEGTQLGKGIRATFARPIATARVTFLGGAVDDNLVVLYRLLETFGELEDRTKEITLTGDEWLSRRLMKERTLYRYYPRRSGLSELIARLNADVPEFRFDRETESFHYPPNVSIRIPALAPRVSTQLADVTLGGSKTLAAEVRDKHLFRAFDPIQEVFTPLKARADKIVQLRALNPGSQSMSDTELAFAKTGTFVFPADAWSVEVPARVFDQLASITDEQLSLIERLKESENVHIRFDRISRRGERAQQIVRGASTLKQVPMTSSCPNDPLNGEFVERLSPIGWRETTFTDQGIPPVVVVLDDFPTVGLISSVSDAEGRFEASDEYLQMLQQSCALANNFEPRQVFRTTFEPLCTLQAEGFAIDEDAVCSLTRFMEKIKACGSLDAVPEASRGVAATLRGAPEVTPEQIHNEFLARDKIRDVIRLRGIPHPESPRAHGIMVAALIGAQCNDYGLEGIAPNASLRLFDLGAGFEAQYLDSIRAELDTLYNPLLVNASVSNRGGLCEATPLDTSHFLFRNLTRAIAGFGSEKLLIVAAAGQSCDGQAGQEICSASNHDDGWLFPACLFDGATTKSRSTLVVAGGDGRQRILAPTSNYSSEFVDVAAPWGPFPIAWDTDQGYVSFPGTSAATAVTTGVLARLLEKMPEQLNAQELRYRIAATADLHVPFAGEKVKFGWLNAARALFRPNKDVIALASRPGQMLVGDLDFLFSREGHSTNVQVQRKAKNRLGAAEGKHLQMYVFGDKAQSPDPERKIPYTNLIRVSRDPTTGLYTIIFYDAQLNDIRVERNLMFYPHGERARSSRYLNQRISFYEEGSDTPIRVVLDDIVELFTRADRQFHGAGK